MPELLFSLLYSPREKRLPRNKNSRAALVAGSPKSLKNRHFPQVLLLLPLAAPVDVRFFGVEVFLATRRRLFCARPSY